MTWRMKDKELNSPVYPNRDPYPDMVREAARAWTARKQTYNGMPGEDRSSDVVRWGPGWPATHHEDWIVYADLDRQNDPELFAQTRRTDGTWRTLDDETRQHFALMESEQITAWEKERERAQREVRLLERVGEPVPDALRASAEETDARPTIDEMRRAIQTKTLHRWQQRERRRRAAA